MISTKLFQAATSRSSPSSLLSWRCSTSSARCASATKRCNSNSILTGAHSFAAAPPSVSSSSLSLWQMRQQQHTIQTMQMMHPSYNHNNCSSNAPLGSTIRIRSFSSNNNNNNSSNTNYNYSYPEEQRKQDHKHCVEMVQTRDMEGYLCGLLMPSSSAREAFFAIRAFNVEIASIKDASQLMGGRRSRSGGGNDGDNNNISGGDSLLGSRLRMQWWRDAISEIYESMDNNNSKQQQSNAATTTSTTTTTTTTSTSATATTKKSKDPLLQSLISSRKLNPTLRSLTHAIHTQNLTHQFLRRMMEAREMDLEVMQYERVRDVAHYGEDTVSSVLYLSLECVGVRDEASDMVASDIGVGLGLLTALRSTAFRATQGECSIPIDLATKHSITMNTLWNSWDASMKNTNDNDGDSPSAGDSSSNTKTAEEVHASREALRNATREMAQMASFHLLRARENQGVVPKVGRPCLLPAVCGLQYLRSLEECDYDVLHPSLVGGGDGAAGSTGNESKRRLKLMLLLGRAWLTGTF